MAGKKKEASLQVAITNQGQWDELLATKGLIVVDVYQRWCGPCCAVFSLFRKIKNELGDNLLHFATAEADSVDSLQRYRGKCEPTFVFYGGGSLVAELHGANAPLLQKMVLEQLEQEKRVMEQGAERRMQEELMEKDLGITHNEQIPVHKSYTIAVIKPDVVTHGKTNEIIMKIQEAGFEITGQEVRMLTRAEAEDFYQHMAAESYFRELVQIMCNGPSHILLISHREQSVDVIQTWRKFTDTATMEGAKGEVTDSLKGQCGASLLSNALHGCSDRSQANRALALFFPGLRHAFAYSQDGAEESTVERTLALIPPAISREDIILRIPAIGLNIVMKRELLLTEEQIRQFYWQHLQEDQFPTLLKSMSRGPILALVLSGHDAVKKWRSMLDVDWAQQSSDSLAADLVAHGESINLLYGSHTADQAEQEIQVVFPPEKTLALIKPDTAEEHKDEILKAIQDAGFSILHMMEVCLSQVDIEKLYRKLQDKPFFNQLVDFMCSGPCMALILSKYRAVQEWRAMMGPNDPCQTHEITTESLRVRFGKDILHNAVHGSSSPERAKEEIHLVFGDVCREENQASLLHGKERALDSQLPLEGSKANVKDELQHPSTPTMMLEGEAGEGVL
ncbi:thioredoxin domain-containing protein 6 isoform X2 [Brienomyrus brachyistius]|uniref:thioredoxin domain-containing protein 6 isoform X2 n=1 Tax=Brienomyrus brachyistius TaxID=42636 RepID=UPI0020B380FD|nr:thioredoxin domain-containing protein 6 isoform X2 [Brienomyrus brachyistius]